MATERTYTNPPESHRAGRARLAVVRLGTGRHRRVDRLSPMLARWDSRRRIRIVRDLTGGAA